MRRVFIIVIILGITFFASPGYTQKVGVFGHLAFPLGDFGDEASDKAGYAGWGFGGGVELAIPTATPTFSFVVQGRIVMNSMDEDALQNDYEEIMWYLFYLMDPYLDLEELDVDVGRYINIPFMCGARFDVDVSPEIKFFGKGLLGVNFAKIPKLELAMDVYDWYYDEYYSFDAEVEADGILTSFCFGLGAGLTINEKWQIGFEYLNLGEPEGEGELTLSTLGYSAKSTYDFKQPISMMTIYAGVSF